MVSLRLQLHIQFSEFLCFTINFRLGKQLFCTTPAKLKRKKRINFETEEGESYHVTYSMFRISDTFSDFTLVSVGEFTGTLGE